METSESKKAPIDSHCRLTTTEGDIGSIQAARVTDGAGVDAPLFRLRILPMALGLSHFTNAFVYADGAQILIPVDYDGLDPAVLPAVNMPSPAA